MTLWIDTHCHLDAAEFDQDRKAVRTAARTAGVGLCVIPAVHRPHWEAVRALAHETGDAYALGIHPLYTPQAQEEDLVALEQALAAHIGDPHLVAIGEIGLDFFVPGLDPQRQQWFYSEQVRMAQRFGLPVIVHVRRSADALLKVLRQMPGVGGIAHAFNGSAQQAQAFIDRGFCLGFGGAMTFDRALQLRRLAHDLPAQHIVMETDAPDMPPHWCYVTAQERAGGTPQGRNAPDQLPRIGTELAQLRGITPEAWAAQTTHNALRVLPKLRPLLEKYFNF